MGTLPSAVCPSEITPHLCQTHTNQTQPPQFKMVNFSGKWVFDHAENMEAIVEALNIDKSKIPDDRSTTAEITQNGDTFQIKTTGPKRTRDITFSIGKSFIDPDIKELRGVDVELTPSWDGDKLVMTGSGGNSGARELVGGQMVVSITIGGVTGKRFFNKA